MYGSEVWAAHIAHRRRHRYALAILRPLIDGGQEERSPKQEHRLRAAFPAVAHSMV